MRWSLHRRLAGSGAYETVQKWLTRRFSHLGELLSRRRPHLCITAAVRDFTARVADGIHLPRRSCILIVSLLLWQRLLLLQRLTGCSWNPPGPQSHRSRRPVGVLRNPRRLARLQDPPLSHRRLQALAQTTRPPASRNRNTSDSRYRDMDCNCIYILECGSTEV